MDVKINGLVKNTSDKLLTEWDFKNEKHVDPIDYSSLNHVDLLRRIDRLEVEKLDLINQVKYYEDYLKFLEENYRFELKSLKNAKMMFDKIGDINE